MRWVLLVALAACAVGCGPSLDQLRWRASHDLNCPENQIVMTPLDEDGNRWGLRGCDRAASYALSEDTGKGEWVLTQKPESDPPAPSPAK
jgi:hypothetical protein